jgi:hypothetical protein
VFLRDIRRSRATVVVSSAYMVSGLRGYTSIALYPTVCLGVGHVSGSHWTLSEPPHFDTGVGNHLP